MLIGVGMFGVLLAVILGVVLGRYVWPATPTLAQSELARREQECASLRAHVDELNLRCKADADEARVASGEVARLMEREKTLAEKVRMQTEQLAEMQQRLTTEFENIANRILKASTKELADSSGSLLDPLRLRLNDFQQKVEMTYEAEKREVLSLKEQIKMLTETSHDLVKAWRGDSQRLGRWGELALERILEFAGLQEGREYIRQGRGLQLKGEDGSSQKPDIVVFLPENRHLIVNSKAPLVSYERLVSAQDETERSLCREQLVRDVKGHISDLSGKRYQEIDRLQAHDCVLMFVSVEGALVAALTYDPELLTFAWERGVVLVGPPTLLMTMRTVASIWRYDRLGKNVQRISKLAGDLCAKIDMSVAGFNIVTEKLGDALEAHSGAVKRLTTGKGNVLAIGKHLLELGAKAKRGVPAALSDGLSIAGTRDTEETNAIVVEPETESEDLAETNAG